MTNETLSRADQLRRAAGLPTRAEEFERIRVEHEALELGPVETTARGAAMLGAEFVRGVGEIGGGIVRAPETVRRGAWAAAEWALSEIGGYSPDEAQAKLRPLRAVADAIAFESRLLNRAGAGVQAGARAIPQDRVAKAALPGGELAGDVAYAAGSSVPLAAVSMLPGGAALATGAGAGVGATAMQDEALAAGAGPGRVAAATAAGAGIGGLEALPEALGFPGIERAFAGLGRALRGASKPVRDQVAETVALATMTGAASESFEEAIQGTLERAVRVGILETEQTAGTVAEWLDTFGDEWIEQGLPAAVVGGFMTGLATAADLRASRPDAPLAADPSTAPTSQDAPGSTRADLDPMLASEGDRANATSAGGASEAATAPETPIAVRQLRTRRSAQILRDPDAPGRWHLVLDDEHQPDGQRIAVPLRPPAKPDTPSQPQTRAEALDMARRLGFLAKPASDQPVPAAGALAAPLSAPTDAASPATVDSETPPLRRFDLSPETWRDKVARRFVDQFRRIGRAQDAVTEQGGLVTRSGDVAGAITLYPGRAGERLRDFHREVDGLVSLLADNGISVEEAGKFLYARHAPTRDAVVSLRTWGANPNGSGFPGGEAAANAYVAKQLAGPKGPVLRQAADTIERLNEQRLDTLEEGSLLSAMERQGWEETYGPTYVPLRDDVDLNEATGQGYTTRGVESHRVMGREEDADNPLVFALVQHQAAILRAEKNRVGLALLALVRVNPDPALWSIRNDAPREGDPDHGSAFGVKEDGEQRYVVLHDPLMARAMSKLGEEHPAGLVKALQVVNRYLAALATSYNPEFVLANFARDLQTASIHLSGEQSAAMARRVIVGTPKAIAAAWRATRDPDASGEYEDSFNALRKAGGLTGWAQAVSFGDTLSQLEARLRDAERTPYRRAKRAVRGFFELVEDANRAVESGVRLSAYHEARQAGQSDDDAARLAKNLTVNFNRKGEWSNVAGALYLFANASVQGSTRMLGAVAKSKRVRRIAYGITVSGALLSWINRLIGDRDEEGRSLYDAIPEHIRERNLILMLPEGSPPAEFLDELGLVGAVAEGRGRYVKLPAAFGYNVFHAIGTSSGDLLWKLSHEDDGGATPTEALGRIARTAWGAFSPIGTEESLLQVATPTILDPLVQTVTNETFYGADIVPPERPGHPDAARAWRTTPESFKAAAELLNELTGGGEHESGLVDISPATIEHWISTASGGAGRTIRRALELPEVLTNSDRAPAFNELPSLRLFLGEPDERTMRIERRQQRPYADRSR